MKRGQTKRNSLNEHSKKYGMDIDLEIACVYISFQAILKMLNDICLKMQSTHNNNVMLNGVVKIGAYNNNLLLNGVVKRRAYHNNNNEWSSKNRCKKYNNNIRLNAVVKGGAYNNTLLNRVVKRGANNNNNLLNGVVKRGAYNDNIC